MQRKIGEIFEFKKDWYQCVEIDCCAECSLFTTECGSGTKSELADEMFGECSKIRRSDNKHVIFKKLEKVGGPYMDGGKIMQKYNRVYREPIYFPYKELNCYNDLHGRICIEIKQNKEDMGEKNNAKHSNFEKIGKNLKPFDLQKAREGKPVCTRDRRKARIICFDRISGDDYYKIVACVTAFDGDFEEVLSYGIDGYIVDSQNPKDEDLMMLPEKKEGWVNVYKNKIHNTFESAEEGHKGITDYIKTIKVEWEE